MKYTAKGKQGIQTLTHAPLATYQVVDGTKVCRSTRKD